MYSTRKNGEHLEIKMDEKILSTMKMYYVVYTINK